MKMYEGFFFLEINKNIVPNKNVDGIFFLDSTRILIQSRYSIEKFLVSYLINLPLFFQSKQSNICQ